MKKLSIFYLFIIFLVLVGVYSCSDHDSMIETLENTRISKIKLEYMAFDYHWVMVDLDYADDKISLINLITDSRQSKSRLISQYEYDNDKISRCDYGPDLQGKETYALNSGNLIEWLSGYYKDGQFKPTEKIQYEYENNNLKSFIHFVNSNTTFKPIKYHKLSYEGKKIINYKAFNSIIEPFNSNIENVQWVLDYECIYNYQDDNLLYIDKEYSLPNTVKVRYSFIFEGSVINKIIKQYFDDLERESLNYFEFVYDELGRIKTINYKSGIENSYNDASSAKWNFEYEIGKSNLKFDADKILLNIVDLNADFFPEIIITDFFSIYAE